MIEGREHVMVRRGEGGRDSRGGHTRDRFDIFLSFLRSWGSRRAPIGRRAGKGRQRNRLIISSVIC